MKSYVTGLFILYFLISVNSKAAYFQSPVNDANLGSLQIHTEHGESKLANLTASEKPVLLVPAYFACNSSCPLMTENLRDAISGLTDKAKLTVIILSFNQKDGPAEIKMFREHHRLPDPWILAVADREYEAKELLNSFGYQFQKTSTGFDHPNSAFFFSSKTKMWSGIIAGIDNKTVDIQKALDDAKRLEDEKISKSLVHYLRKPEYLIILGFVGLLISLSLILFILIPKNKKISMDSDPVLNESDYVARSCIKVSPEDASSFHSNM